MTVGYLTFPHSYATLKLMPKFKKFAICHLPFADGRLFCLPIIFGFFLLLFSFALPCLQLAMAQTKSTPQPIQQYAPVDQTYDSFVENIEKANETGMQNVDSYYATAINRVLLTFLHMLGGNLASDRPQKDSNDHGLIGFTTNLMGDMYRFQPASGVGYVADLGRQTGVIDKAYAQDNVQGFNRIQPLLPLWRAMLNLAYILYIPIFIFVGITIMLRQKINPHTVASVQAAIPKIILSLVLVTFSFAIVGFMIDIMNLSMSLIVNYFVQQGFIKETLLSSDNIYGRNIFDFVRRDFDINNLADIPANAIKDIIGNLVNIPGIKNLFEGATQLILKLVFMVAVIFVLFRVLMTLILAYIGVLGMTILGPVLLVFDAIPGRNGFGFWFKNLLANLAVFPAVLALLLFASVVGGVGTVTDGAPRKLEFVNERGISWVPPFLGDFAGEGIQNFVAFIAFGAVLMMPTMLAQLQKFLKVGLNLGPLLEPVTSAAQPFTSAVGAGAKYAYEQSPAYRYFLGQQLKQRARAAEQAKVPPAVAGGGAEGH